MKNCSTIKPDEFCINVYSLNQNLFWKGRSWKAWGRATEPDLVTNLPNPIYTAQMHIASFPFMKINSVFQMSLRGEKKRLFWQQSWQTLCRHCWFLFTGSIKYSLRNSWMSYDYFDRCSHFMEFQFNKHWGNKRD